MMLLIVNYSMDRVLLENVIVTPLVKKFPPSYGT
jgi:hypothetical protein